MVSFIYSLLMNFYPYPLFQCFITNITVTPQLAILKLQRLIKESDAGVVITGRQRGGMWALGIGFLDGPFLVVDAHGKQNSLTWLPAFHWPSAETSPLKAIGRQRAL